jgi:hypothetical protein
MGGKNYIPANILAFLQFGNNLIDYSMLHFTRWEIPEKSVTELKPYLDTLEAAVEISENPDTRTTVAIRKRNEKRAVLDKKLRRFIQGRLMYNNLVTCDDLIAMSLPVHDKKPKPHSVPHSRPGVEVKATNNRQHTISAVNQQTGKRTKPADVYGIRYYWEIRNTPPANADDLSKSVFSRKTKYVVNYNEEDRGKTAYYSACYENSKGEIGPYSDIVRVIIP